MFQNKLERIVIVGATSSIAEHCARLWLSQGVAEVFLVGRDAAKTQHIADDLLVRSPQSRVNVRQLDFLDPAAIAALAAEIAAGGAIDLVLIAHGSLPDQLLCQRDLAANADAMQLNGISPVLFAEAFVDHMQRNGAGTLGLIGSVAGDRGRKSNYVYGSAKGLVTRYAQGLQHRLARTKLRVVLIKPGPTDTPMTAHLKQAGGKLASVEQVAREVVNGMAKGKLTVYAPGKWFVIMMVIRHLPYAIFKKMDI
jgi:decaprenylphospho-beta-D-erythro-pentofuranosid-2-ulose 2-reductase